jgi:hypothetical protein
MTTSASDFPCIEAMRCFVAETELGQRLTIKALPDDSESKYAVAFSTEASQKEEWYTNFEVVPSDEEGGAAKRYLQLRHFETNLYIGCDDTGRVTCDSSPSTSTWWLMGHQGAIDSSADGKNGGSDSPSKPDPPEKSSFDETEDEHILYSKKYPLRRLTTKKSFDPADNELMLIASKNESSDPSNWTLKFTSGELCFIVNPVVHHHLRCNKHGGLSLTSQSSRWEVFRFIEAGNGDLYISSWANLTKFLSSNFDGQVYTTDTESASLGLAERWHLESPPPPKGNGLFIRNVATRRYLSLGRKRSEHLWTTTKPNDYALWHLDSPHLRVYYLTSLFAPVQKEEGEEGGEEKKDDKITVVASDPLCSIDGVEESRIASHIEGPYLSQKKESDEEWKLEVTPEGYFTFFSVSHEKYLGCNSKGDVHTTTSKGAWTLWEKQASPHGGVTFKSKEHKRFLAVTKSSESLCTTEEEVDMNLRQSWRLDPRMPRKISGGTGAYIAGMCIFETKLKPCSGLYFDPAFVSASVIVL